ncbi:hypothetical protein LCGC14_1024450 [marine sediment metagenome]|uniref:Glycosyltransferase subfamily 4-like N-terminal domain-containing protein n=1 Tax=marine sediment metagenome TaxID=412755 RepID=A0A0F9R2A0_9ZZZZ
MRGEHKAVGGIAEKNYTAPGGAGRACPARTRWTVRGPLSPRMRIVLVYQHFMVGGVGSTKPYDLARSLRAAGHDVTVICGRGYLSQGMDVPRGLVNRLVIGGVNVICLGVDYRQQMAFGRRVAAFLAFTVLAMLTVAFQRHYDVLLVSSTPLTVGMLGLVSRYVRRIPYVFEIRDLWPEVPYRAGFLHSKALFRLSTLFEEWFYRESAAVCAISRRMCDRLIERGVPARKVHFVPTGVALAEYDTEPDRAFLEANGLAGCWVAAYVGSHGRVNALDYLVAAAEHLQGEGNIRIVAIGDGSEKRRLRAEAQRRGVLGGPLVMLDPVPRRQVPGILMACDAMLMINSSRPGMGYLMTNKFFDYLASGRPIVANVRAELTEWMLHAGCGELADPDDPQALAEALRRLRDDPDRAARMGSQGRELARREFDRHRLGRRWERILAAAAHVS